MEVGSCTHDEASQTSECAILHGQNEFLAQINDECKKRRSTDSYIVGRTKVMVWEGIDKATTELGAKKKAEKEAKKTQKEAEKADQEAKKAERERLWGLQSKAQVDESVQQ